MARIVDGPFAGKDIPDCGDYVMIWVPCGDKKDRWLPIPHKAEVGYGGHRYFRTCYNAI